MNTGTQHPPTLEQTNILYTATTTKSPLMLQARAGCGKTHMLKLIAETLPGPKLYIVFGHDNAKKARKDFPSTTIAKTANSVGYGIWGQFVRSVNVDTNKVGDIFRALIEDFTRPAKAEAWEEYDQVRYGLSLARALGYIPDDHAKASKRLCDWHAVAELMDEPPSPLAHALVDACLIECIRQSYQGVVDFQDQCYMPALFGGIFPRFPTILIDEYQDLDPVQHELIRKLAAGSRIIGVGDEAQAIYGFRGGFAQGMADAIIKFGMQELPLSVSFRCPQVIVENVHWRVPDLRALRQGGKVAHNGPMAEKAAVICRLNAPLLDKALKLLYDGTPVSLGGIDQAPKILKRMAKLGPEHLSQVQAMDALDSWESSKGESKSAADTAACIRVFLRKSKTLGLALALANHAFSQKGTIHFFTGHKAKGLEFDHVIHLRPEAIRHGQGQDDNVMYVIDTRARETLTYWREDHVH